MRINGWKLFLNYKNVCHVFPAPGRMSQRGRFITLTNESNLKATNEITAAEIGQISIGFDRK